MGDAAAMLNTYPHLRAASVGLRNPGDDSVYFTCDGGDHMGQPYRPFQEPGVYHEWRIHNAQNYKERLDAVRVAGFLLAEKEPFKSARFFRATASLPDKTVAEMKAIIRENMPGWRLVDHQVYYGLPDDSDP